MTATCLSSSSGDLEKWWFYYKRLEQGGVYHRPDYVRLLERHYYQESSAELFIYGDDRDFVYYPYFKRSLDSLHRIAENLRYKGYWDVISSWYYGGPLASNPAAAQRLAGPFRQCFGDFCRENKIVSEFIRFDPYLGNYLAIGDDMDIVPNRDVVYIDLTLDRREIVSHFKKKCRKNIKRAQEGGVTVNYRDNERYLDRFSRLYTLEMKRKNAPAGYFFTRDFFEDLLRLDGVYFITLTRNGDFMGGSIAVGEGNVINDYLRATDPEFWHLRINDWLIHENIFFFKEQGYDTYDLQGGRKGVIEFKQAFSGLRKHFSVGRAVHLAEVYQDLADTASVNGNTFFPAYRENDKN